MNLLMLGLCMASALAAPRGKTLMESGAICEGKASAFFVVDNTQMIGGDNVVYKDFSEEECMSTCSNNRDPFGRSILCSSFVYDHVVFTCTIFKEKSKPVGNGEKTAAAGKRYFEKFCLAEEIPMECAEAQFTRADDSVLVGFATNVTLSDSLEDCVALCVKTESCMSAMYFYEEGECITNTESAMSRPASFTKEDTEKVIYFTNGCAIKKSTTAKTVNSPIETQPEEPVTTTVKSHEIKGDEYEEKSSGEGSGRESGEKSKESTQNDKPEPSTSTENTENARESRKESTKIEKQENTNDGEEDREDDMKELIGDEYDDEVDGAHEKEGDEEEEKQKKTSKTTKAPEEEPTTTQAPESDNEQTDEDQGTVVESEDQDDEDGLLNEGEQSWETESEEPTTKAAIKKHSNENTRVLKFKKPAREFGSKTVTAYKKDKKNRQKEMEHQRELAKNMVNGDSDEDDDMADHGGEADDEEPVNVAASALATENESTRHPFIKSTEVPADPSLLFSEWSDWTPCTKSGERRVRRRKCLDLRRCLGALMQVENCPAVTTPPMVPEDYDQPPLESVRSIVPEPQDRDTFQDQGARPVPLPPIESKTSVWSPWLGVCQQFASGQPCNNGEMIGFESRECLAKDPSQCTGPFFRYCTLNC